MGEESREGEGGAPQGDIISACIESGAIIGAIGAPIASFELLFLVYLLRHVRAMQGLRRCDGKPHTRLSHQRLSRRLRYITRKFGAHAPFWQFVLWARLLVLAAVVEAFSDPDHRYALIQIGCSFASTAVVLALHMRTQPCPHL